MPPLTHITVTAPDGVRAPIHPRDGRDPTGVPLCVVAGVVDRVRWSLEVRRAIGRGDLIPCDMNGAYVASVELAAAPDELPGGRVAIVQRDLNPSKVIR